MKQIERFLNSQIYPLITAILAFVAWYFKGDLIMVNYGIITGFLVIITVILAFFKDTKHVIPLALGLMFMINIEQIGLTEIREFSIVYIVFGLSIIGLAVHFLRFKHKFKFDWMTLSFLLIAVTYVIPMVYMPYSNTSLVISFFGFVYVILYLFFKNTSTARAETILTYFFYASLTILAQILYSFGTGFLEAFQANNSIEETLILGLQSSWSAIDYGYGTINDVIIYFTVLSSGMLYKIVKSPKNFLYWIVLALSTAAIILSGSRGGYLSWAVLLIAFYIILVVYGKKAQVIFATVLVLAVVGLGVYRLDIAKIFYENFVQGGIRELDAFSSGRITLYKNAWETFKQYPYFGAGWTYKLQEGNTNRIQIYHSTIFHTLAISGIAGAVAVAFFVIIAFIILLKKMNLKVAFLGLTWVVTMLHGLVDNTVHMIIFTLLTIFMFTAIQREEEISSDEKKQEFYDFLFIDQL